MLAVGVVKIKTFPLKDGPKQTEMIYLRIIKLVSLVIRFGQIVNSTGGASLIDAFALVFYTFYSLFLRLW